MWNPRVTKVTSRLVCSPCCRVLYVIGRIDSFPGERGQANQLSGETTAIQWFDRIQAERPFLLLSQEDKKRCNNSKNLILFPVWINQNAEGAHLSWEAPSNAAGNVSEYSVYLAIRSQSNNQSDDKPVAGLTSSSSGPVQLAFVRVYCGAQPTCTVSTATLQSAHIDFSTKPAIIFRIAAKNDKGSVLIERFLHLS